MKNPWVWLWGGVGVITGYYVVKHFRMTGGRII